MLHKLWGYSGRTIVGIAISAASLAVLLVLLAVVSSNPHAVSASTQVIVPGTQDWTDTGIPVPAYPATGYTEHYTASGTVSIAAWDPGHGPDGDQTCTASAGWVAPGLPCWSLIGKYGENGTPFFIGSFSLSGDQNALQQPADLYLGVNDQIGSFGDNSGSWTVNVTFTIDGYWPTPTPQKAEMLSPAPGSTLAGTSVTFSWTAGTAVQWYLLWVGSSPTVHDLADTGLLTSLSYTVNNLPVDGRTIYVQLTSYIGTGQQSASYTYTAAGSTHAHCDSSATILAESDNSTLYCVDPNSPGSAQAIGLIQTNNDFPSITDIALSPSGALYGITVNGLYSIDKQTGHASFIGDLGTSNANALTFNSEGQLYAGTGSGDLLLVDPAGGTAGLIGSLGGAFESSGDLAFSPDGQLYGTEIIAGEWNNVLVRIDKQSGTAQRVGQSSNLGSDSVFGLAWTDQGLLGLTDSYPSCSAGALISIDTNAGTSTFVGCLDFGALGGTAPPPQTSSASFTVHKTFSDNNSANVSISLACSAGSVTNSPQSASESSPAVFTVTGVPQGGTSCTAHEVNVPPGYTETDNCTNVAIAAGGSPSCTITNTRNDTTFTVHKVWSDAPNANGVSVSVICTSPSVAVEGAQTVTTASPKTWNIHGYTAGATCTATENATPAGYTGSGNPPGTCNAGIPQPGSCTITNTCSRSPSTYNGLNPCDLQTGDIILIHETNALYLIENAAFKGYWTHAVIYDGRNGKIVESYPDPSQCAFLALTCLPGVTTTPLQSSSVWKAPDWAILRVKSTTPAQRAAAVDAAATRIGDPYNLNFLDKNPTDKFYCSQLVWWAYKQLGIDLDNGGFPNVPWAVAPDDLFWDNDVQWIALRPGVVAGAMRLLLWLAPTSVVLPLSANVAQPAADASEPVHIYITDALGRHAGFDPATGQVVNEIPGVAFSGIGGYPEALSIENFDSTWTVQVVGQQQGSYTLAAITVDVTGPRTSITHDTNAGQVDTFTLMPGPPGEKVVLTANVSPSPSASPTPTPSPTPSPTPTGSPRGSLGDTNCDGRIDGTDVMNVLSVAGGVGTLPACIANGDVDGDGHVTAMDGLLILKFWAGLITSFPASAH